MKSDVHVMPQQGRWKVSAGESQKIFETQREAEQYGRQQAKQMNVEFILHGEDGRIRERDSYGNDPRDVPG